MADQNRSVRNDKNDRSNDSISPSPPSDSGSSSEGSDSYWAALDDGDRSDAWWEEAGKLADQSDEREYVVTIGRETGPMTRWYGIH